MMLVVTAKYVMYSRNVCALCVCNCVEITQDFLAVLEKCPSKMRKKLTNHKVSVKSLTAVFLLARDTIVIIFVMMFVIYRWLRTVH